MLFFLFRSETDFIITTHLVLVIEVTIVKTA